MAGQILGDSPREILRDRYQIQQRLGKKSVRQTFLALDLHAQQLVVVKLLTFSSDFNWDDLKLFEREAQTLQALSHPSIPRYIDSFELNKTNAKGFALVQSYIEAPSLEEHLLAERNFSEDEVKEIAKALLEILTYLHGQKPPIIHRDIKPSNILLTKIGQVYLVDFGSVQTLATQEGKTVTVVGTYGYMPPEQFGGRALPASDIYSLGATLIALVTKAHPADLPHTDMRIQFEQAVTLSPAFTDWLKWMTEPSLDRRLDSAQSAREALDSPKPKASYAIAHRRSVTTLQLLWNSLWRSTAMGTVAVTAYAAIYSTFIFPGLGTMLGAQIGGILGMGLGLANGLLVGILTRLFFFPLTNAKFHRQFVSLLSTSLCTTIGILYFKGMNWGPDSNYLAYLFWVVAPSLIAGLSMGASSKYIARWYEWASRREEEE